MEPSKNEKTTTQADINNLKEQSISKNPKVEEFELEGERGDSPFLVHVLAGSVAGLMEHVLIYPIDTIKVLLFLLLDSHAS